MGKQLVARVEAQPHWSSTTTAVLQYLAARAKRGRVVRDVSLKKIAGDLKRSWQRIKVVMQQLRTEGFVEIIERGRGTRTNVYRLHLNGKPGAA